MTLNNGFQPFTVDNRLANILLKFGNYSLSWTSHK